MTDDFFVDLDALRVHRDAVRNLVADLDAAAQAISQVTAPTDAYGVLCSPLLALPMALVQADASAGVTRMRDLMDATADNLETTAVTYESTDTDVKIALRAAGGGSATGPGPGLVAL